MLIAADPWLEDQRTDLEARFQRARTRRLESRATELLPRGPRAAARGSARPSIPLLFADEQARSEAQAGRAVVPLRPSSVTPDSPVAPSDSE